MFTKIGDNYSVELAQLLSEGFNNELYIKQFATLVNNVVTGDKVYFANNGDAFSAVSPDCSDQFTSATFTSDSDWIVNDYYIGKEFCFSNLDACFKRGNADPTDINNNPATDLIDKQMTESYNLSLLANIFLATKGGATTGCNQGDGILSQCAAFAASDSDRKVAIENPTRAGMSSGSTTIELVEEVLDAASPELKGADNQIILMSDAMWRAYRLNYVITKGIQVDDQVEALFGGLKKATINGIPVIIISRLDGLVGKLNSSDAWYNKKYWMLYTTTDNIQIATKGNQEVGNAEVSLNEDVRKKTLLADVAFSLGVKVLRSDYFEIAY